MVSQEREPQLVVLDTIDSTNEEAFRRLAVGRAAAGSLFLAFEQTAGRGRTGAWSSPRGECIALSAVLTASGERTVFFTMIGALAVCDTVASFGLEPVIKWPNDVLVGGAKISGVLADLRAQHPGLVVLGIGLNVRQSRATLDGLGLAHATSLALAGVNVQPLATADRLIEALRRWEATLASSAAAVADAFAERTGLIERRCLLETPSARAEGVLQELTPHAELVLALDSGASAVFKSEHVRQLRAVPATTVTDEHPAFPPETDRLY
jgi:BirA family biotin operon repressor/biotin-[acetyl-CoA-carboxylase] ligase